MIKGGPEGAALFLWEEGQGDEFPGLLLSCAMRVAQASSLCNPKGGMRFAFPPCQTFPNKTGRVWRPPGKSSGCGRPEPGRWSSASAAPAAQPEVEHEDKQSDTHIFHGGHLLLRGEAGSRRYRAYSPPPSNRFFISLFCRTISRQRMALSMARRICSLRKGLVIKSKAPLAMASSADSSEP